MSAVCRLFEPYDFCSFAHLWVIAYYSPFCFQAIPGASTLNSGLIYLPLAVSLAIGTPAGGPLISFVYYYYPTLILNSVLTTIGSGLITILQPDTTAEYRISFQVVYGVGMALPFNHPTLPFKMHFKTPWGTKHF